MAARRLAHVWWFAAPFAPMVASQLERLHQITPADWLIWDYAGRLGALAVLAAIPAARVVAFRRERLKVGWLEAGAWVVGLFVFQTWGGDWIDREIGHLIPDHPFGSYPMAKGALHLLDMTFGVALVAVHEEIMFRRCARAVMGDGWVALLASALLFAAYHWWTGLGNMVAAFAFGLLAMLAYRRLGAVWPVMVAHYAIDFADFL